MAEQVKKKQAKKILTKRQAKFVSEYANPKTKTAIQAALNAGYSKVSAAESASENLRNSYIFEQIEMRKRRAAQLAKVTPEQIIGATAAIAFSSIEDATDEQGNLDFQKACRTGAVDNIKKISRTPNQFGESVSWELYSKSDALAKLGNYMNVENNQPKLEHSLEELGRQFLNYLMQNIPGIPKEKAVEAVRAKYGDVKLIEE